MPLWPALCSADHRGAAKRLLAFTAIAAFFTFCPRVQAAEPTARVVLVGRPTSPLVQRLREESEALGFEVQTLVDTVGPLDAQLDAGGVVAVIRVLDKPNEGVELVISEPGLQERIHERLPIRSESDPTAREVVATRAVELLRAVRLQVAQAASRGQPPQPARPAPLPAPAVVPRAKPTTTLSLTPLVSYAQHSHLGLSVDLQASYVPQHWGLGGGLIAPLTSQRLEHEGGDITATVFAVHAALLWEPMTASARSRFGLRTGLGLEASRLHFEGQAPAPLVNTGSTLFGFGPRLELQAALHLAAHVRLILPASASYALPRTVVRFAGDPISDFGPLLLRAGIGAEWYWL